MSNISYKRGCLIDAFENNEVTCIAHQANCFNTMGSGIAKAIRERLPVMYTMDCATQRGSRAKLGKLSFASIGGKLGFNLYGQYMYGRDKSVVYTDYNALRSALALMALQLRSLGYMGVIGLPKMGCGSANGDWAVVSAIIMEELDEWPVIVYEK